MEKTKAGPAQKALCVWTATVLVASCSPPAEQTTADASSGPTRKNELHYPEEKHLEGIHQLTFGGDNAEAYFSFDGKDLVFQSNNPDWNLECDQIFTMPAEGDGPGAKPVMVSTGNGRTTCAYFLPGDSLVLYAGTHHSDPACPPVPERRVDGKYVWPIYDTYDIFIARRNGKIVRQLTDHPGYDAEATVSPDGKKIVFTSMRTGDPELFVMNVDGSDLKQITSLPGYDGGAFFSPDSRRIVFRASRPDGDSAMAVYSDLLSQGLVMPTEMELFICNADGTDLQQITRLGKANWAPFFHPSGNKVIFSSNHHSEKGYPFNLFLIEPETGKIEQVTFDGVFDSFPMFSPDGKTLVFSSNRNNGGTRATNIFTAAWKE